MSWRVPWTASPTRSFMSTPTPSISPGTRKSTAGRRDNSASSKRQAGYYEAVFHSRLAAAMRDMGFDIRREGKWWDLAEISPETVTMFSRRTEQVEQDAARLGITDPEAKGELGKRTREGKEGDVATEDMRAQWWDRHDTQGAARGPGRHRDAERRGRRSGIRGDAPAHPLGA